MLPIYTSLAPRRTPWVTYVIVTANVLVHLVVTRENAFAIPTDVTREFGFIPANLGKPSQTFTFLTCLFLHGDLYHLAGNMLFLMVFARPVEDDFGKVNFLVLYLSAGFAASLIHAFSDGNSMKPLVGASGAISGLIGATLICNPRARITFVLEPTLIYLTRRPIVHLPSWLFALGWFFLQLGLSLRPRPSNIAFASHAGGFLAGAMLTIAVRNYVRTKPDPTLSDRTR